ncbi:MAG: hypothetical protein KME16_16070 [Scytolyngbya sp. HA4215-MV1]|jgi:hypothetical protein|nr:hypothetical protein [Scytolyngbya sp. HA4215-MV1]
MTWRGSNTVQDRIFSCLVYIFPLVEVVGFGMFLFGQIPGLAWIYAPLLPFMLVYATLNRLLFGYGSFLIFMVLYLAIVRNENLRHFLRFNTMQCLMLAIFAYLCQAVLSLLGILRIPDLISPLSPVSTGSAPLPLIVLSDVIFLAVWAGSVYSIAQAARGLYSELPVISEASYAQTR